MTGPRFVLNPIKIFDGSFGGATLWENPHYVSPAKVCLARVVFLHCTPMSWYVIKFNGIYNSLQYRRLINKSAASKYLGRVTQKANREINKPGETYSLDDGDDIFAGDAFQKAKEIVEKQGSNDSVSSQKPPKKEGKGKEQLGLVPDLGNPHQMKVGHKNVKVKGIKNKKIAAMKLKKAKTKAKVAKQDA